MPKSWIEVRVDIPSPLVEAVSNFLIEQGSPGVIQEKVPGPSGRKKERIVAYFLNGRSFTSREGKIRAYLSSMSKSRRDFSLRHRAIQEEKWAEAWKANFKAVHVTPRLVIKPPWGKYPGKKGEMVIEIDPGMAFGTGTHPSTQMCLQTLEELTPSFPQGPTVLDVGTGSGILAIAARKLGARKIQAIDIDPIAIGCARKNAAANHAKGVIDFRVGSLGGLRRRFDIVVANLLPQELLELGPMLAKRVNSRGFLIASGILRSQKKEIAEALASRGLTVWLSRRLEGWVCLILRPTPSLPPSGERGGVRRIGPRR
ncbi:MAG: 50S ribosomal protein L11 methyltransferase [Thermodesulfobacteriota bacterium]|jgi:ribosomal protein L11 methyltransferase